MNTESPTPAPTPRTDAERHKTHACYDAVTADFARTLERELLSAQAALTSAQAALSAKDAEIARLNGGLRTIRDSCENCTNGSDLREQAAQVIGKTENKNPMVFHSEHYNCERFTAIEKERDQLRAEVERLKAMIQTPAGWTQRGEWKPECNSLYVYDADGKLIGSNHPIAAVAEEYRLRYERIQLRAQLAAAKQDTERLRKASAALLNELDGEAFEIVGTARAEVMYEQAASVRAAIDAARAGTANKGQP